MSPADPRVVVVGLGYVGLPLAVALAKHFDTVGFDVDKGRIAGLRAGRDRTGEVAPEVLGASRLVLVDDPGECPAADVYIVTVPTPIDAQNMPDLAILKAATATVAGMIDPARTPIVVFESTVYPGVTEEICGPILEQAGLVRGRDFLLGYSPERINPGDREHTVERITKVVAAETPEATARLAGLYGRVTSGGTFAASSIQVAEAAKVIENAQRDINIAFMNEITRIFAKSGISVWEVLAAARTKWNFLPFQPGLVGGHCIGVDPYYLSYRAQQLGHNPEVILAGRATNDAMALWVADSISAQLAPAAHVLVLGLTFKEDVPDLRNSKVADLVTRLRDHGHRVDVHDPLADPAEAEHEYGIKLRPDALAGEYDAVLLAVAHAQYRAMPADALARLLHRGGLLADLKNMVDRAALPQHLRHWSL